MNVDFDTALDEALAAGPDAVAIACADVRAGFVIGASARGEEEREAATNAAACAAQFCATPHLAIEREEEVERDGALIVSSNWIHAYARVDRRPDLVIVGVARGDGNVALLVDWVKRVAGGLGASA